MGEVECERDHHFEAERHLTECARRYEGCGDAEDKLSAKSKFAFLCRLQNKSEKTAPSPSTPMMNSHAGN
ncbi:hypothetical protein Mal15_01750 [Stieleria maiorica]|uniref:Uncharacterized protein n=1 Tax=Stieleria maiorica TaxID=2795974 RepID=A0A5B9M5R1_9BACT|nr:hypothetical protein Mal15_01750 [Stieleria maiorica]